jgi:hypothetical protein
VDCRADKISGLGNFSVKKWLERSGFLAKMLSERSEFILSPRAQAILAEIYTALIFWFFCIKTKEQRESLLNELD